MNTLETLKQGKADMKFKCIECALLCTPDSIQYIEIRKNLSGRAGANHIAAPKPFTRKSLYIFLHECAHVALKHQVQRIPRHVMELQAEQWAHARMREFHIAVPRVMTKRAKEYVARKIHQAEVRGAKHINSQARKFANS